jgi:microcompartment protein CcmK/EutM
MLIGRIEGNIVATRKEPRLEGFKFYIVGELDPVGKPTGKSHVGVDLCGAGVGEYVLLAQGSSARQSEQTENRPVDCAIIAVVDIITVDGTTTYQKY